MIVSLILPSNRSEAGMRNFDVCLWACNKALESCLFERLSGQIMTKCTQIFVRRASGPYEVNKSDINITHTRVGHI